MELVLKTRLFELHVDVMNADRVSVPFEEGPITLALLDNLIRLSQLNNGKLSYIELMFHDNDTEEANVRGVIRSLLKHNPGVGVGETTKVGYFRTILIGVPKAESFAHAVPALVGKAGARR